MKTPFTLKELAQWVDDLIQAAGNDTKFNTFVFPGTVTTDLSIIGGWKSGFGAAYSDLLCVSDSDTSKAMCIQIVKNPGFTSVIQFAARDFSSFELPTCLGLEEDTCVAIEWEDIPEAIAGFYMTEWERLTAKQEVLAV